MTSVIPPANLTQAVLGPSVKKTQTIATETRTLFTVTGLVCLTGLVGVVTTSMTVANTVKVQANPTVGTTGDLCAATDLGTTDTLAGSLIGITGAPAESIIQGIGTVPRWPVTEASGSPATGTQTGGPGGIYVNAGTIEAVVTGTSPDGVIDWYINYVPISPDGKVVAA